MRVMRVKAGSRVISPHGPISCRLLSAMVFMSLLRCSSPQMSRETVHDDPFVVYPYRLSSTSPFGRIPDSVLPGSQVPADSTLPHFDWNESTRYLTLQLIPNENYLTQKERWNNNNNNNNNGTNSTGDGRALAWQHKRKPGYLFHSTKHRNASAANGYKPNKGIWPGGALLPEGVRIDISGEEGNVAKVSEKMAFTLDENLHIIVGNSQRFKEVDGIEFWVVAIQQEKGRLDSVVSNPLSFVIKVDHPQPEGHGAPVYAGIVVVVVCVFALLIPLTVRTKRRLREGKPLCVCGSSTKKLEERLRKEAERGTGISTVSEKSWESSKERNSLALMLQGRLGDETVSRPRETFQSKNMRSPTSHHFQPLWLDPHYKESYDRPVFNKAASSRKVAAQVTFACDFDTEPSTSARADEKQVKL